MADRCPLGRLFVSPNGIRADPWVSQNPEIRYLDYFTGDYDHVAHLTADPVSQLHTLENLDALVGRIWNAIASQPLLRREHGTGADFRDPPA